MKKIKLLVSAVLIVAMCSASTITYAQGTVFDVDAAITKATQDSHGIRIQQYNEQLAENAYDQAKQAAIKADNQLTMNDNMLTLAAKPDASKTASDKKALAGFVPLSQDQIYQLKRTKEIVPLQAEYQLQVAQNSKEVIENTLKLGIYTQYSLLMDSKELMDTEQEKIDNLDNVYKKTQLQLEFGTISKVDAKKSEVSYLNEKPVLEKMQRQMKISEMNMNYTIGESLNNEYVGFSKDILTDSPKIKSLDDYIKDALINRTEIVNAQEYLKLEQAEMDLAKQEYPDDSKLVNVQTRYNLDEAKNNLEILKLNIQQEITNSYNDMMKRSKNIESIKKSYNLSKKNYDYLTTKYNLGLITKTDLVSAEVSFKQVENNLNSAERDLWISQLKLEYQCGKGINSTSSTSGNSNSASPAGRIGN